MHRRGTHRARDRERLAAAPAVVGAEARDERPRRGADVGNGDTAEPVAGSRPCQADVLALAGAPFDLAPRPRERQSVAPRPVVGAVDCRLRAAQRRPAAGGGAPGRALGAVGVRRRGREECCGRATQCEPDVARTQQGAPERARVRHGPVGCGRRRKRDRRREARGDVHHVTKDPCHLEWVWCARDMHGVASVFGRARPRIETQLPPGFVRRVTPPCALPVELGVRLMRAGHTWCGPSVTTRSCGS